ncbi:hypothetical protein RS429_004478 [Salmonella enterica]|nr:hypothetical protein [Salmonella enterica subsp. enterica serovar Javiana]EBB5941224.1 hypothetical protein [Salmonella enterica]EBC2493679.1 hypothetical protein [Salmonella enterica subsp. enterica serovar Newport]EBP7487744.1 hypothetical protein [Salmonella enterica subsp. enterica]ECN4998637.1 hypothetical protein [Salmonella enterica subsp. enterica serovar Montevideo]ECS5300923.1 hypothetical protein [Salmonella enterica subsp. enterica serovar Wedding]
MRIQNTALTVALGLTVILSGTSAATPRANSLISLETIPSVGFRPVDTTAAKKMDISGDLITGSKLDITNIYITDKDGDLISLDKMVASSDKIKWYLVDNDADIPSGSAAAEGLSFTIPGDAGGKKIKVVYRIVTATGTPDTAHALNTVLLTTASSGVGGDQAADGTISNKVKSVTIRVNNLTVPTVEVNGTANADTPVTGGTLEAVLACATATPAADCSVDKYDFQWQIADAAAPSTFTDITSSHAESNKYTVKGTEQNKLFRVNVTPKTTKKKSSNVK